MVRYRTIHVSIAPQSQRRLQEVSCPNSAAISGYNEGQNTNNSSSSRVRSLAVSTNSINQRSLSTAQSVKNHRKSIDLLFTIDLPEIPSTTRQNKNRKKPLADSKKKCLLVLVISLSLMCMLFLGTVAIATYTLVSLKSATTIPNSISTTGTSSIANTSTVATTIITINTTITTSTTSTTTTGFFYRWNSTGITLAGVTGSSGTNATQLSSPYCMALDSSNTLYVSDRNNNRVQKFLTGSSTGTTIAGQSNGVTGTALNYLNYPAGVDVDSSGNIYVVDSHNNRVLFWPINSSTGTIVAGTGIAGTSNSQLDTPFGIAHDWGSNIFYVTDQNNHRVMSYLSNSTVGTVVAGNNGPGSGITQLYYPLGIYFDSTTNSLFIVNYGAHSVVRWVLGATNWRLVAGSAGVSGSTSFLLLNPFDVTFDSMANMYVADSGNHRIQFFFGGLSNGTTVAGMTGTMGSSSTLLNQPTSVTVDPQFNIYVVDYGNSRVQEFLHY